jgi:hypothetical protein
MTMKKSTPMTKEAAARIQSANAKATGGKTPAKSFPARAQTAADTKATNG